MGRKGPKPILRSSKLIEDNTVVGRSQAEVMISVQNAKGEAAFREAMENCRGWFKDCSIAMKAHRLGPPPQRSVIPATNASSLYSSALASNTRRR
jgi:hypothetical protein